LESGIWNRLFMDLSRIVKEKLISLGAGPEDAYLVAVSGGADSTALLLAMKAALGRAGDLTVAHLDHSVRPGSRQDLERVLELCGELGIRSITDQLDFDELDAQRRIDGSLEAGMRKLRYRFLFATARNVGSKWIVTGHTKDDQAETVLFRVTRGMDWRSLKGIPERRGMILRPFIDVSRSATWSYCMAMGISPVTDPSNYDETYARARLRNRILPGLLTSFNPGASELLCRLGQTAGLLSLAEEKLLDKILPGSYIEAPGFLERDPVLNLPAVLQKRVIVDFLVQKLGEYPSTSLVDDALEFILAGKNGQISLPGGRTLTLSYGLVHVGKNVAVSGFDLPSRGLELKIPGSLVIPSAGIAISAREGILEAPGRYPRGKTAFLSKKGITGSLWVRKRLSGDRFMPIGMDRDKKLKDFLIDRKVPRATRDLIPIVLDGQGDIVWVGGIEISQKAALDGVEGEEAILVSIEDLTGGDPSTKND
jgi:tRNA(Ile)-lysidine synthase